MMQHAEVTGSSNPYSTMSSLNNPLLKACRLLQGCRLSVKCCMSETLKADPSKSTHIDYI